MTAGNYQPDEARAERRIRFFTELATRTRALSDPDAILATATHMLAGHLEADRCAYIEVQDQATFRIVSEYARHAPTLPERSTSDEFGSQCVRRLRANEAFVIEDVSRDPRLEASDLQTYRSRSVQALIGVPLHVQGKLAAAMVVHQPAPRRWAPDDVALVQFVAAHCWEALERARVTSALRQSDARYCAIVEATPECVMLIAADGKLLQINSAGLAMLACDDSEVGRNIYTRIAPEYREQFQAFNEQVCRGQGGTLEYEICAAQEMRRRMKATAVPLPASGEQFTNLVVARDVTERAAAERALAASRNRLDYAARIAGIGFWYSDLPLHVLDWDARVKEHFWLPEDATVTIETFYERLHPEDREPTRQAVEASIASGEPYTMELRTVNPLTGAIKWIRALGSVVYGDNGEPVCFDGVTQDITARKFDEQRLASLLNREREQARLLRKVADAALNIFSARTLDAVLEAVAEQARSVIGTHLGVATLISRDDRATKVSRAALSDKYAPPAETLELGGQWPDVRSLGAFPSPIATPQEAGRRAAVERLRKRLPRYQWLSSPLLDLEGTDLGAIEVADKIEGEFTASDQAILAQFAHVASVALENARLYGELHEQDRRKDEFLAILAHELRNPLAPLRNGLQILRLGSEKNPEMEQVRAMMERQLAHMVHLIDDLLDISRFRRNMLQLRRSRVLLSDVIRSAVETVQPAIDVAGHELTMTLPDEPVYIDADLTRLAQVFGNLLSNSAKYTPHGGRIWLTAIRDAGEIIITVRDTGIGIPAESLPNIFDMFSQVDRSMERTTPGMGIGLALVKGLVEMHGGTVEAASPGANQGSTFTVRLPVLDDAPPLDTVAVTESTRNGSQHRRILVVDDNRDSATTMALMLQMLGNEVRTAHDGLEALEVAEEFRPGLVLMDVGMPRLNGYDATRRLREQPWGRDIAIYALTGWGQEADRMRSQEAGCDGHLVKPLSLPDLEKLLAQRVD